MATTVDRHVDRFNCRFLRRMSSVDQQLDDLKAEIDDEIPPDITVSDVK